MQNHQQPINPIMQMPAGLPIMRGIAHPQPQPMHLAVHLPPQPYEYQQVLQSGNLAPNSQHNIPKACPFYTESTDITLRLIVPGDETPKELRGRVAVTGKGRAALNRTVGQKRSAGGWSAACTYLKLQPGDRLRIVVSDEGKVITMAHSITPADWDTRATNSQTIDTFVKHLTNPDVEVNLPLATCTAYYSGSCSISLKVVNPLGSTIDVEGSVLKGTRSWKLLAGWAAAAKHLKIHPGDYVRFTVLSTDGKLVDLRFEQQPVDWEARPEIDNWKAHCLAKRKENPGITGKRGAQNAAENAAMENNVENNAQAGNIEGGIVQAGNIEAGIAQANNAQLASILAASIQGDIHMQAGMPVEVPIHDSVLNDGPVDNSAAVPVMPSAGLLLDPLQGSSQVPFSAQQLQGLFQQPPGTFPGGFPGMAGFSQGMFQGFQHPNLHSILQGSLGAPLQGVLQQPPLQQSMFQVPPPEEVAPSGEQDRNVRQKTELV